MRERLDSMNLAILHYHLNVGGVTIVILNHLRALAAQPPAERPEKVVVLSDGQSGGWPKSVWAGTQWEADPPFDVQLQEVGALRYDTAVECDSESLAADIAASLNQAGLSPEGTVLHTHNHSLGKNASLPGALRRLSVEGWRLLLQVHDFAEDFRPANYRHLMRSLGASSPGELGGQLYPAGGAIHYASLNGRDQAILSAAGAGRPHLLANAVSEFPRLPAQEDARERVSAKLGIDPECPLVLYPVRGIRRKNLGELLLYSALSAGRVCYAVTLAPANPVERVAFDRWAELSAELNLNCLLGVADGTCGRPAVDFLDALSAADALITTSVAEGFGMVFLEAWLAGRPLIGRDLPEITSDFVQAGLRLDGLRGELLIPLDWLDVESVGAEIQELHDWACRDYGVPRETSPEFSWPPPGDGVDFAALPRRSQEDVIRRAAADPDAGYEAVRALNDGWTCRGDRQSFSDCDSLGSNAECVRTRFSPTRVGGLLVDTYRQVLGSQSTASGHASLDGEKVLENFLRIDRLHPVRLEA